MTVWPFGRKRERAPNWQAVVDALYREVDDAVRRRDQLQKQNDPKAESQQIVASILLGVAHSIQRGIYQ